MTESCFGKFVERNKECINCDVKTSCMNIKSPKLEVTDIIKNKPFVKQHPRNKFNLINDLASLFGIKYLDKNGELSLDRERWLDKFGYLPNENIIILIKKIKELKNGS